MKAQTARNTPLWSWLALALFACESPADKGTGTVEVRKEQVQPGEPSAAAPSTSVKAEATAPAAQANPSTTTPPSQATAPAKLELKGDLESASAAAAPAPAPGAPSRAAPAQAELVAAATRQGSVVSDTAFSTWLEGNSPVPSGPAQLQAVLVAKPPYHVNAEYPHKFTFGDPPAGLEYPEKTVRGMQITPERGALRLPVLAKSAGPSTVSGTLSFSVCTEERCLVEKRELQVALDVK